jgi:hypothetical protein
MEDRKEDESHAPVDTSNLIVKQARLYPDERRNGWSWLACMAEGESPLGQSITIGSKAKANSGSMVVTNPQEVTL